MGILNQYCLFLQEFGNHDNVIKLLNVIKAENDKDIYLVFDFMGKNHLNFIDGILRPSIPRLPSVISNCKISFDFPKYTTQAPLLPTDLGNSFYQNWKNIS